MREQIDVFDTITMDSIVQTARVVCVLQTLRVGSVQSRLLCEALSIRGNRCTIDEQGNVTFTLLED